jgi:hypothetical protein
LWLDNSAGLQLYRMNTRTLFDRIYFLTRRMIRMKTPLAGLAIAALLTVASTIPGFAEDAPKTPPADAPAATTAAPADTTPGVAPRPSLLSRKNNPSAAGPKADEPKTAEQPAADAPPLQHRRHYAHRHHRYWGNYRYAYWEPFPIFFPHVYHNRIHWNRIPWMFRF